ncbi:tetratricopeptide repeat-containing sensor histidine kinase [Portibacter marinus]|uniref:tetratricopeptide repeat-containing sensor histidine kinase n=1 Tax=Portibacter marinus TaxID=2898660 RepID=UPI001F25A132|nr:histidine kinase [Portibacter marinus]
MQKPTLKIQFTLLLLMVFCCRIYTQNTSNLQTHIDQYLEASSSNAQYDALARLMEYNANVSVEESATIFEKLHSSKSNQKDLRNVLLAHFIAGDVLYYNERPDSALQHYLTLASEAKTAGENMLATSGLGNASYVLSDLGDKTGAIQLLKQNLNIARNTGDIRDYSDYLYNIANSYSDLGMIDSSIHYFEKCIDTDRKANNKSGMLYNMLVLLDQYIANSDQQQALALCNECLKVSNEVNDTRSEARCFAARAMVHLESANYSDAENDIREAIKIDENRKDLTRMSKYYRILAATMSDQKRYGDANNYFNQSLSLGAQYTSAEDLIETHLAFARSYFKQQRFESAIEQTSAAKSLIDKNEINRYQIDVLALFGEIYSEQGLIEQALEYEQMESELLTDLLANRNLEITDQSKHTYDLYKLENINRALRAEKQLADLKVRRRNIIILSSASILALLCILGYFAYNIQRQKARIRAQELEFQVVEKELLALRSQMNPHFLFNSLNSINDYIMHEEPRLASRYLTKFSTLMRTILNHSKEQLISLEDELHALQLYVEMENLRFTNQFSYQVDVDPAIDPATLMIPSMILQPYIENAIKHGLRNNLKNGILSLSIGLEGKKVKFEIYDNGVGRKEAMKFKSKNDPKRKSHGMNITTDRLQALNKIYDIHSSIEFIDHSEPSGTTVILLLESNPKKTA